jgi:hypothetical protein
MATFNFGVSFTIQHFLLSPSLFKKWRKKKWKMETVCLTTIFLLVTFEKISNLDAGTINTLWGNRQWWGANLTWSLEMFNWLVGSILLNFSCQTKKCKQFLCWSLKCVKIHVSHFAYQSPFVSSTVAIL